MTFSVVGDIEKEELEVFLGDITNFQPKNSFSKFEENIERQENFN